MAQSAVGRHLASDVQPSPLWARPEDAVIVVTLKVRAASPQAAREICRLGYLAVEITQEPGFLRIRCVVNIRDPQQVLVSQEWGSRAAFDAWFTSAARAELLRQLAPLMEGDWQIDVYDEV